MTTAADFITRYDSKQDGKAYDFALAYGSDNELHKAGCSHLRKNSFWINHVEIIKADSWQEALDMAAFDWLEAVDYADGQYDSDDIESIKKGVDDFTNSIPLMSCARKLTARKAQATEITDDFGSWLMEG